MNDSLYNPDSMSKEDIKTLFVARQPLLDELVSTVRNQPQGAGVQHLLIIAPRGMGKTTMLLMLQFAAEDDKELSKNWQAVRFPEESYGITELADFWLKVLQYLADPTDDEDFKVKIKEIESRFSKSEDLREAAWALVKDWSKKHKKRILLLVDNFDMILDQIGNDTEQARLRDILMNDGTIMLIGGAPSYFHQIQNYEQPLYNFFKIHNLNDLKFPDIEDLLRRRAELDEIENIEELLQKNRTRIKALETFTGGNPRLVLMLYRIITSSDMTEVTKGLESLLDAVTPLYKDKTEKLPAQQRKIINEIAQYSLEKREGISPTEIAQRIRMTPNQVSSQLKRLAENGYVRALNIRGRSSFYVLSEPLYAIWAQMRFGRNAREKRNWLVQILKALFDVQEIQKEIERLGGRVVQFKADGRNNKARGTLEYMLCLLETHPILIQDNFTLAVQSYLELEEFSSLKLEITQDRLNKLPEDLIGKLLDKKIINESDLTISWEEIVSFITSLVADYNQAVKDMKKGKTKKALNKVNKLITILQKALLNKEEQIPSEIEARKLLACSFSLKGTIKLSSNVIEALSEYDKAIEIYEKLNKNDDENESFIQHIKFTHSAKFLVLLIINDEKSAAKSFADYVNVLKKYDKQDWIGTASKTLLEVVNLDKLKTISNVVKDANVEREFLSIIYAIEYIQTKDETLIEKLSPEFRIVVEETIRTLQALSQEKSKSKPNSKMKNKKDRKSEKSKSLALSK